MKRFITHDLGYALQIFAVILLFGYPGCSLIKGQKEVNTEKTGLVIEKDPAPHANLEHIGTATDSLFLLNQWDPAATKYSLFTGSRK